MPLDRRWVDRETDTMAGPERELARFALIVAKSAPQMDDGLVERVFESEEQFIRLLAWASFSGARRVAAIVSMKTGETVCV